MALGGGTSRWPAYLAWTVAGLAAATGLTALAVGLEAGGEISWKAALLPALWGVPGAMLAAAQPRNAVGWLVLVVATIFSGSALAEVWARLSGPGDGWAVWYVDRFAALLVPCTVLALLLLPDGRLPSRGWRLPVAFLISVQVGLVLAWAFVRGPAAAPDSEWPAAFDSTANPVGVLPASWSGTLSDLEWLLQLPLLLVLLAVVLRLVRADSEERTRVMSLLFALGVFVVAVVAGRAVWSPVADFLDVAAAAFLAVVLVSAVLRRRLEGVAVVVSHSFVYAVLVVLVATGYAVVVGLLSTLGAELAPFGAGVVAAASALAVLPLRSRLQRLVDRVMHGDRADPYAALTRLASRAHGAPTSEEVLAAVAGSVAVSLRVPWVRVTAFGESSEHGTHGTGHGAHAPLVSGDTEVGSIEVVAGPGRRLGPGELTLLETLGRHAGVTIEAVRLAEAASLHQRGLVAAREEERRRLGRELHDELGPTVAGLSMQLGALRDLVRTDPDVVVDRLDALHASAMQALADIRRVAHDLRPPVLDQLGLAGGLRQLAESLGLRARIEADLPPLSAMVELAAYRICAEALTNIAHHAGASQVVVDVRVSGDELTLTVVDDGRGLPPNAAPGLGIDSMRERASELGGRLVVTQGPAGGTRVYGVLPLRIDATAEEAVR
ncbi:MAG TPA: histidine kinase [Microlunatus sp.]|nr:histidine kinase [Microlunatus sp.]